MHDRDPRIWRVDPLEGTIHGFTGRQGGVSPAPRESLHLARRDGDADADIVTNWSRVAAAAGFAIEELVLLDQVHGDRVVVADRATGPLATLAAADGVVSTVPGRVVAVRTADCVPVLLAAPGGVAAAHAGWRGIVAGVVPGTVHALVQQTGASVGQVVAAIGPCAGVDRYETGPVVVEALVRAGLPRERIARPGPRGRAHSDLRVAVTLQLRTEGVRTIAHVDRCTMEDPELFSHRRDGAETGRQAAFIGLPS